MLKPGDQTGVDVDVRITCIQPEATYVWEWSPNSQVAAFTQCFPQYVLHRLRDKLFEDVRFRLDDESICKLIRRMLRQPGLPQEDSEEYRSVLARLSNNRQL